MTNRFFLIAALAAAAALAACGGGGSSSSDTGTGSGGSSSGNGGGSSSGGDVQTSVPASTYTAGSAEASAFTVLNNERQRCGFGLLAQSAKLDTAASGHAQYLVDRMNSDADLGDPHTEDQALSGFTGATLSDRLAAVGYAATGGAENISFYNLGTASVTTDAQYGSALVHNLMATIYHQASLLGGNREIGFGVRYATSSTVYPEAVLVADLGTTTTMQSPTGVLTYPCSGSTNVQPYMLGESPNPFTGLGFDPDSSTGQPIYVRAASGRTITLTAATITAANGTSIPVTLYGASQDPNGKLGTNESFVVPRAGLAQGTTYSVTVSGTVDGSTFTQSFSFSTLTF